MNVLYIAYSCDPFNGSEDQIGWNIPRVSDEIGNVVHVITKMEHKESIKRHLEIDDKVKIKFHFVDIPRFYKKLFKGNLYSLRVMIWQKKAFKTAKRICKVNDIEIIHQVAPVEFRAIGNYGKIKNIPFVLGPIGGGFPIPKSMRKYTRFHIVSEGIRKLANLVSFAMLKFNKKIQRCDYVFFLNEESRNAFQKHKIVIPENKWSYHCEIGIVKTDIKKYKKNINNEFIFLVPGRLVYRKGHKLLLESIPRDVVGNIKYKFRIIGDGPMKKKLSRIIAKDDFLMKHVDLAGKVPYTSMQKEYLQSSVVILPSLSEGTGTVLIEALANCKPVITSKYFGAKTFLDESVAWLYDGKNNFDLKSNLSESIKTALNNNDLIEDKSKKACAFVDRFTWENRLKDFMKVYKNLIR